MRPLALLLSAVLAPVLLVAQGTEASGGDGPVFSLEVKVVNVIATVRDRNGRLLSTLTKDDFILTEDGVRQDIRYFSHQTDLPLTIGLLIDTSGSQRALISAERSAGLMFFRSILRKDKDLAFLMSFDRNVELLQDYTASLGLLERGLGELQVEVPVGGLHPGTSGDRQPTSTALHDALYLAAHEMFSKQVGRKAVVVISDGHDYGSKVSLKAAIEASQRADIVVYTIRYVDWAFADQAYTTVASGAGALKKMSEETGGSTFHVTRRAGLQSIFGRIEEELRGQYSIGYVPKRGLDSGGFRKISLKGARAKLKIQAREGYYADAL